MSSSPEIPDLRRLGATRPFGDAALAGEAGCRRLAVVADFIFTSCSPNEARQRMPAVRKIALFRCASQEVLLSARKGTDGAKRRHKGPVHSERNRNTHRPFNGR